MLSAHAPREVTLIQMLDAREKRAERQKELIAKYHKPLLCFTMNIAGPIKNSDLIRKGFHAGIEDFLLQMKRLKAAVLYREMIDEPTGNEAFFVVDIDGFLLKQTACELEEDSEMGRLFDMDVIIPMPDLCSSGKKLDRQEIGFSERKCLICGGPVKACSSRRAHSVQLLQKTTNKLLTRSLHKRHSSKIAELATRSLLYEVAVSPKPGLVDRFHNGSHKDMDIFTFLNSASALHSYFYRCAYAGLKYGHNKDMSGLLPTLRIYGKGAEAAMFRSTGGINTHKGAIFTIGILCAAFGANAPDDWKNSEKILQTCACITSNLLKSDFTGLTMDTAKSVGEKLYVKYGITGVRGQMTEGLPVVSKYGLPLLSRLLAEGKSIDEAGSATLLTIMAHMTDTNLIARSDMDTQKTAMEAVSAILQDAQCPSKSTLEALDSEFTAKNLSPGGSADMLTACWMLYFMKGEAPCPTI